MTSVRCVDCNKKLAEYLDGTAIFTCKRCRKRIRIDTHHNTYTYLSNAGQFVSILTDIQENGNVSLPRRV